MPVRRVPGGKKGRVYALRSEISKWLGAQTPDAAETSSPQVQRFLTRPLVIGVAALVVLGGVGAIVFSSLARKGSVPARVRFTERAVQALDDEGRRLWTYTFAKPLDPSVLKPARRELTDFVRVIDLMGDGKREVLIVAPLRSGPNRMDEPTVEVDCLSSQGFLLWSYAPNETYRFDDHELKGPWNIFDVMVSQDNGNSPRGRIQ
ncbi:MAG: hypothetical protein HY233_05735 [Acidobacteriales bacterium]|nr:hypothetical protein [Terriglobales bacterium]